MYDRICYKIVFFTDEIKVCFYEGAIVYRSVKKLWIMERFETKA